MTMPKIPVMEVFGPTIQGEGMVVGQKTVFVRTGGCDFRCSWCDSKFTWDGSQKSTMMTAEEVFDQVVALAGDNFSHVTISGGNPALITTEMSKLIDICHWHDIRVGLETQGSRWQDWFLKIDDLTLSPKPPSSGMKMNMDILDNIVHNLASAKVNFSIKIVVFDDVDFEYAAEIFQRYEILKHDFNHNFQYYISVGNSDVVTPDVTDVQVRGLAQLEWLFNKVIGDCRFNDVRPLPQLHTLVWGNKRSV